MSKIEQVTAYRFFSAASRPWYVSDLKGNGGADWGYSDDINKSIPLNRNQWQSFAKDMRECNTCAFALSRS